MYPIMDGRDCGRHRKGKSMQADDGDWVPPEIDTRRANVARFRMRMQDGTASATSF